MGICGDSSWLASACSRAAAAASEAARPRPLRQLLRQRPHSEQQAAIKWLGSQIVGYQKTTWHWERLMGVPAHCTAGPDAGGDEHPGRPAGGAAVATPGQGEPAQGREPAPQGGVPLHPPLRRELDRQRRPVLRRPADGPGLPAARTAPWLLRTKGTADHWTPLEQIWTAEKAAKSRGFWPWPNTARSCGLL